MPVSSPETPSWSANVAPDFKRDFKRLLFYALATYVAAVGLRLAAYPAWSADPATRVGNAPIMNTPDAYAWLAGAVRTAILQDEPMAIMARSFAALGPSLDNVAYFTPVLIASLVGPVVVLWAWTLGSLEAGLAAGLIAASAPGFFGRTHLGFYDTDMVTLLFPLLAAWMLAQWLRPYLAPRTLFPWRTPKTMPTEPVKQSGKKGKRAAVDVEEAPAPIPPSAVARPCALLLWALGIGVFLRFANPWHERLTDFNLLLFYVGVALVLLLCARPIRPVLLWGMAVVGAVGFHGWPGMAGALALIGAARLRPAWFAAVSRSVWPPLLVLAGLLVLEISMLETIRMRFFFYLQRYLAPVGPAQAAEAQALGLGYPAIAQSVAEDSRLGWVVFELLHWYCWPAGLGVLGFFLVMAFRPAALLLTPLTAIGLSGIVLGARMAMFASPAVGLGLALPLTWLASRLWRGSKSLRRKNNWRVASSAVLSLMLGIVFLWPGFFEYPELPPKPCLSPEFARVLMELSKNSPADCQVWCWWDWGYAANYYARRATLADGGAKRQMGFIHPLSLVLGGSNPLQANQMIHLLGRDGAAWLGWNKLSPDKANEFFASLGANRAIEQSPRKQYVAVNIEALAFVDWMTYFASWDFYAKQGVKAKAQEIEGPLNFNPSNGTLLHAAHPFPLQVASADLLRPRKSQHLAYGNGHGAHFVYCEQLKTSYLLDDRAYDSLLVRLLLGSPDAPELAPYFRLVFDGSPMARIYEVL
jgi:dolichyl-diphosphooligosaccharide--protein glycosyltransferase